MRRNRIPFSLLLLLISSAGVGQVVAPFEMKDPALRGLQQKYIDDLKSVGKDIVAVDYPYPFYLSRKLDIDEQQQKIEDQRSVRFDYFNGQTVLAVTGNYYAAYPAGKFSGEQRARETFLNVAMPVLKAAVPRFQNNKSVQGYALEISHHILGQVMGVTVENPENLVVFLPQSAALKLLAAKDETAQQVALLEGQTLLNAEPVMIWSSGKDSEFVSNRKPADPSPQSATPPAQAGSEIASASDGPPPPKAAVSPAPKPLPTKEMPPVALPPRDTSPEALSALQATDEELLGKMSKELDPQAHFVSIAAPTFVAFRQGIYLELSLNTTLPEWAAGSRYKLAALAFDGHISQLIRPTLTYFKEESKFDGISFSTTLHPTVKGATGDASEAVEFFFPFTALRCYQTYDCTGQQLIDAGTVLINGERVSLDLQIAEGGSSNR
jgi:hypothetical protein